MTVIEHADILADLFGHWPDFHDAELRTVSLNAPGDGTAFLELGIEVAEMSDEVDERGFYRDRQRCHTVLRFENVLNARLDGFRYQNVLDALVIQEIDSTERGKAGADWSDRQFRVTLVPIPAFCDMEFLCDSIRVLTATVIAPAI